MTITGFYCTSILRYDSTENETSFRHRTLALDWADICKVDMSVPRDPPKASNGQPEGTRNGSRVSHFTLPCWSAFWECHAAHSFLCWSLKTRRPRHVFVLAFLHGQQHCVLVAVATLMVSMTGSCTWSARSKLAKLSAMQTGWLLPSLSSEQSVVENCEPLSSWMYMYIHNVHVGCACDIGSIRKCV